MMKRRKFFEASLGTGTLAAGLACTREPVEKAPEVRGKVTLAGMSIEKLRDRYRLDLFDKYLPFFDKYIIDHELGGFMCNADRDGTLINTNKRAWYDGRGTWLYSFIYNNIDPNPQYLEVASKTVDFILKTKPSGKKLWITWI